MHCRCLTGILLILPLAGCARQPGDEAGVPSPGSGARSGPRQEWSGQFSGIRSREQVVVRKQADWQELWQRVYAYREPKPDLPAINFERDMVVGVFLGEQPSGGYSVQINDTRVQGKDLLVTWEHLAPPEDQVVAGVTSQPYHLLVVPAVDGEVSFAAD